MLPRFERFRILGKKGFRDSSLPKRCRSTTLHQKPTANPELAYMHNPGKSPLLEVTVGKLLENAAERWPNRDVVISIHKNTRMTYSELLSRANKLAAGLKKIGLRKGDRIGLWSPNEIEWLVSYMAAARVGLVATALNPAYQLEEAEYCIRKVGAKAAIASESYRDQKYAQMLLAAKKNNSILEHIIIYGDDHVTGTRRMKDVEMLADKKDVEAVTKEQDEISQHQGLNIQFTSGTTGKPKAAVISHRSLVNNTKQLSRRLDYEEKKICLNVPYFHAFGMVVGIVGPLHSGSTVVLESPTFNPVKSIEAILKEKCNVTFGTPTMWANMIDVQNKTGVKIETLITGSVGGAPASPSLYRSIRESLRMDKIKSIYGLTETTAIVNQSLLDESYELTDTTVGYISDHLELKVIDDKDEIVPFGAPGELCVRGYSTMLEYWDDIPNTKKTISDDGWLKTGDQYVLRKDGYGLIVGRLKDMLIRGGENIFPKEIEHFLETHPDVIEAHAFGVHDDVYGEEICACIRLRSGKKLSPEDIAKYAKGKIAHFKIPRYIQFCDEFPKTTSGKIQKFKLKEELENRGVVPKKPKY